MSTNSKLINMDGAALLIVDVQEKLLPLMNRREEILKNIVKLIRFCKKCEIPVIVTEQYPKGLGRTVQEIRSELGDIKPIEKTSFSCFGSQEFRNTVRKMRVKTLIITGIEAHVCIMQTALETPRKIRVGVVADAVSSHAVENTDLALKRMRDSGIIIFSTEMVMYELLRDSKTRMFKEVKELLKYSSNP
ncbi:MAG: hydrolase [Crenarchaeota archaeon]|nr:hydrolase [Thermoproteota archaeon]